MKYLRAGQVYGRVWFKLSRPSLDNSPAPARRKMWGRWQTPAPRKQSIFPPDTFEFLGVSASLSEIGWDGPQREKLWRYNQHYFDDLNAIGSKQRSALHADLVWQWTNEIAPGTGNAWEPYPTSIRIVNWIKWALGGNELDQAAIDSLAMQARWLTKRLERHLLANHLLTNAKALIFAGTFFDGREAERWLQLGLRILEEELKEQILPDGGHFELSTMYHAIVLEDILDLGNLVEAFELQPDRNPAIALAGWKAIAERMLSWLESMTHPDGEIGFFNDAAIGIGSSVEDLKTYAESLGIHLASKAPAKSRYLESSGYVRLEVQSAVALLDLARVGPDHIPGHAHADTLSFELSVFGHRLFVNSGTSCYGKSQERLRQRGTAAHNTVHVDDRDSSEVWSGFRVARRAYPVRPSVDLATRPMTVDCAHDGYKQLPGRPLHKRHWEMGENRLLIADTLLGQGSKLSAQARFHVHPALEIEVLQNKGIFRFPDGKEVSWCVKKGRAKLEQSTWHPEFGTTISNKCLSIDFEEGRAELLISW